MPRDKWRIIMKKAPSKDLVLFLVLSIIIVVFTSIKLIDNFIMDITLFILIFVSSGYSLIAVLYPEKTTGTLKKTPPVFGVKRVPDCSSKCDTQIFLIRPTIQRSDSDFVLDNDSAYHYHLCSPD